MVLPRTRSYSSKGLVPFGHSSYGNVWTCPWQNPFLWFWVSGKDPFYVKIDRFWARDLISCVKGYFWPTWRWVNSFFDFCPFPQTFLTFFESPKKPKLPFFELGTWFFVWREVFDQHEHGSNHFLISALLRSKMALWSWAVQYIKWGLLDLFLAAL